MNSLETLSKVASDHIIKPDTIQDVAIELENRQYIGAIKMLRYGTVPKMDLRTAKTAIDIYAKRTERNPQNWVFSYELWTLDATTINKTKNVDVAVELEKLIAVHGLSRILTELGKQV